MIAYKIALFVGAAIPKVAVMARTDAGSQTLKVGRSDGPSHPCNTHMGDEIGSLPSLQSSWRDRCRRCRKESHLQRSNQIKIYEFKIRNLGRHHARFDFRRGLRDTRYQ
jgi:hypothetical protein